MVKRTGEINMNISKQDLEIIIEQIRSIEGAYNDLEDNFYQIRRVLELKMKEEKQ